MKRYALVTGNNITVKRVADYLPKGYSVLGVVKIPCISILPGSSRHELAVVIEGEDFHGWTLDGYVIPRLGSDLMSAIEIDEVHPALTRVSSLWRIS